MKLIDILNKIANGELKEGTKIKDLHYNTVWILKNKEGHNWFVDEENRCYLDAVYSINNEVELIEPDHFTDIGKMAEPTDNIKIEELDKEEMLCLTLQCAIAVLTDKLNEVIRYINK